MIKIIQIAILLATIFILCFCAVCNAGQKYNSMTRRYETVPDSWENKYNSMSGTWSYQPRNAKVEYNSMERKYDWDSGHGND